MSSFSGMTVEAFLAQAASNAPTPGGGGIAALAGALGCSMAAMAANFTVGKAKYAEHEGVIRDILAKLGPIMDELRDAVDDDAAAFSRIAAAYALPKADEAAVALRKAAIADALTQSMRVPLRIVRRAAAAAALLPELARRGNVNLLSDVKVAAIMLAAAAEAGQVNVLANSASLDNAEAREAEAEAARLVAEVKTMRLDTWP